MAFLVLLPAAARTRVVAADLWLVASYRLRDRIVAANARRLLLWLGSGKRARLRRLRPRRTQHRHGLRPGIVENQRRRPARGRASGDRSLFVEDRPEPPEVADDFLVDPLLHRLEEREALLLVFNQRIALAVTAQADAFLEVVEAVEVILPLRIDDLQHDVALDALQHVASDQLLFLIVRFADLRPQRVADFVRRLIGEIEVAGVDTEDACHFAVERVEIPLLEIRRLRRIGVDESVEDVLGELDQVLAGVERRLLAFFVLQPDLSLEDLPAQRVDVLALLVHHVVVLEQVFADREVLRLDLLLRALDGTRHHAVLDRHALFHAELLHQTRDAVGPENPHQVVFERQVEPRRARVALTAGSTAQLVVDATRLVAFGRDDVEAVEGDDLLVLGFALPPEVLEDPVVVRLRHTVEGVDVEEVDELLVFEEPLLALRQTFGDLLGQALLARHEFRVAAEQDVGAAARHVGGDRHSAFPSCLGDELGFLRVVLGVQHNVLVSAATGGRASLQPAAVEHRRELFGLLDRHRADQHRPAFLVLVEDFRDDRVPLLFLRPEYEIGILDAAQWAVGRNDDDVQLVDLGKLFGFRVGGAGHAGQLLVLAEVVLEGDGGERLVLALDLHLLLCFNRLVQAVAPAPPGHQPAGELVDDDDFALLHHVIDITVEDDVRPQRLIDVVLDVRVFEVVEVSAVQPPGEHLVVPLNGGFRDRYVLVHFVVNEVAGRLERLALFSLRVAADDFTRLQARDDAIDLVVEVGRFLSRTGDDQRRPGFVDEDAAHLVDDGEVMAALDIVRQLELHVVAQVVETELVVRAVGDVGGVGDLALGVHEIVLDDADGHAEEAIDLAHPLRVAAGEVVVDGDDMHPLAFERVEVGRERRDQRLAFPGLHLGDLALVQHSAADELNVEVPHVEHAPARLADDREHFRQELVERLTVDDALLELGGLAAQLLVG